VRQLVIKVLGIIDARCNHEVYLNTRICQQKVALEYSKIQEPALLFLKYAAAAVAVG